MCVLDYFLGLNVQKGTKTRRFHQKLLNFREREVIDLGLCRHLSFDGKPLQIDKSTQIQDSIISKSMIRVIPRTFCSLTWELEHEGK